MTGNHIEERIGSANFSIVGRNANWEQRARYADWDKINKGRETVAMYYNQQFKDSTKLKKYAHLNHGNKSRKNNYYSRHSGTSLKGKAIKKEFKSDSGRALKTKNIDTCDNVETLTVSAFSPFRKLKYTYTITYEIA